MSCPCPHPTVLRRLPLLLLLAGGCTVCVLPVQAQPVRSITPLVVRAERPEPSPDPALEVALREALFPARIDDGQGHGPDPGSAEAELAKRHRIQAACQRLPVHRYSWNRVDLGGDSRPERVVQVLGPMFCGSGGCPLLIFREPRPGRLELVTRMSLFQEPLIVTGRRQNGWTDLISRVRVDAGHSDFATLRHDGRSYPANPSVPPAEPLRRPVLGTAYLAGNDGDPRAHPLPCDASESRPARHPAQPRQ